MHKRKDVLGKSLVEVAEKKDVKTVKENGKVNRNLARQMRIFLTLKPIIRQKTSQ